VRQDGDPSVASRPESPQDAVIMVAKHATFHRNVPISALFRLSVLLGSAPMRRLVHQIRESQ
jgi:hypothetical protein